MKIKLNKLQALLMAMIFISPLTSLWAGDKPVNYFYERGAFLDVIDNTGDDKGPGYYQYPADDRMRRGTFDVERFSVYEEGKVIVFEIQMRNYIMRQWPDTRRSLDQGFVANLWDIYVDIDARPHSGYDMALPGRDVKFADNLGWEKVIMVTPLSEYEIFDILRNKTDELSFQNKVDDIVYPDYVRIQRDKVIIKISKLKLPGISAKSGYQLFSMGFQNVVSPNRLLNRDVRAFATREAFGGGYDTYGDPPIMDMIVNKGEDQYKILRDFSSEPYRMNIEYASVPFVFGPGAKTQRRPTKVKQPAPQPVSKPVPAPQNGFIKLEPVTRPEDMNFQPVPKAPEGFIPIKKGP